MQFEQFEISGETILCLTAYRRCFSLFCYKIHNFEILTQREKRKENRKWIISFISMLNLD